MSIKQYSKEAPQAGDDWQGSWGSIAPTPHSVTTLCVERAGDSKERYSYPYRGLSRWMWKEGEPEILEILAGKDRIILTGIGLQRLLEALDAEQLEQVCEQSSERTGEKESIVIHSIQIEKTE